MVVWSIKYLSIEALYSNKIIPDGAHHTHTHTPVGYN